MAAHTMHVFADAEYVVLPSGSCAGMIRCFYSELTGADSGRAESLASRTYELSQFLRQVLRVDTLGLGLEGHRVAYHHGCHALRELGVKGRATRAARWLWG